jgi:sulfur carrier protein
VRVNGRWRPLEDRRLVDLLRRLGYADRQPGIAVAVNGRVVRRAEWADRALADGDSVDVVGAVQGG